MSRLRERISSSTKNSSMMQSFHGRRSLSIMRTFLRCPSLRRCMRQSKFMPSMRTSESRRAWLSICHCSIISPARMSIWNGHMVEKHVYFRLHTPPRYASPLNWSAGCVFPRTSNASQVRERCVPLRTRRSVDLPAPFAPMRTMRSPACISRSMAQRVGEVASSY